MARKRETRTAVDAMLGGVVAEEQPRAEERTEAGRKRRSDYKGPRDWRAVARQHGVPATYRLPESLREEIKKRAEAEDVKVADFVTCLLQYALEALDRGEIELPREE